jgi:hypothetical protein
VKRSGSIAKRPLDLALMLFFSISVLYGFLFSLPEGLGVAVAADSPWPPLRSLHGWAVAQEPAHLDPPPSLIASCLFDGLFQAPFLSVLIYAFVARKAWIRLPSMIYAGASVTNMFYYLSQTFLGPHPPPNLATYLAFNLPWLIAPMLLALRMRAPAPFGSQPSGALS